MADLRAGRSPKWVRCPACKAVHGVRVVEKDPDCRFCDVELDITTAKYVNEKEDE